MALLPENIVEQVRADGIPREAVDSDAAIHMLYLDRGTLRSVLIAEWPAEQVRLAQEETERQQAALVRQQVIQAYGPMVGRLVTAPFTARELQAWLAVITHKLGGVEKDGSLRAPGEWRP